LLRYICKVQDSSSIGPVYYITRLVSEKYKLSKFFFLGPGKAIFGIRRRF
jgi:hypothetical protein